MISPGGTIGILGGGQLGRMMAAAAAQLGYHTIIYAPETDAIAAQLADGFICAPWDDAAALAGFAQQCDLVTWEFENVPIAPLAAIEDKLVPHPRALETAQDRLREKEFAASLGAATAPYHPVHDRADLIAAADKIGPSAILKTCRDGYDGKGQWRLKTRGDVEGLELPRPRPRPRAVAPPTAPPPLASPIPDAPPAAPPAPHAPPATSLQTAPFIYEGLVDFFAEFSVIAVRGVGGALRFWESAENTHEGGILSRSTLPASAAIAAQMEEAHALTEKIAKALDYIGVFTVEFFATEQGPIFNEMAPRVHNSGHWTIEGAATSQFENHIRAICGLPLGDCATTARQIVMENIIGAEALSAHDVLQEGDAHLHLYGKDHAATGRKMGHVTRISRHGSAQS